MRRPIVCACEVRLYSIMHTCACLFKEVFKEKTAFTAGVGKNPSPPAWVDTEFLPAVAQFSIPADSAPNGQRVHPMPRSPDPRCLKACATPRHIERCRRQ